MKWRLMYGCILYVFCKKSYVWFIIQKWCGDKLIKKPPIFPYESLYHDFFVLCPFRRKKGGLGNALHPSIRSSIGPAQTLLMPSLSNHCVDSLQIKFIGTVLAYRCATSWSFAHGGIMGMPMSMIKPLESCWCRNSATSGLIYSKSSSLEPSWPIDMQQHGLWPMGAMGMPMGMTKAFGILWTPELSNHWVDRLELSWPVDVQRHGYLPLGA